MIKVKYNGIFGNVIRTFDTIENAHLWARQVGVFNKCIFENVNK